MTATKTMPPRIKTEINHLEPTIRITSTRPTYARNDEPSASLVTTGININKAAKEHFSLKPGIRFALEVTPTRITLRRDPDGIMASDNRGAGLRFVFDHAQEMVSAIGLRWAGTYPMAHEDGIVIRLTEGAQR